MVDMNVLTLVGRAIRELSFLAYALLDTRRLECFYELDGDMMKLGVCPGHSRSHCYVKMGFPWISRRSFKY
jgi:hypothetical protein